MLCCQHSKPWPIFNRTLYTRTVLKGQLDEDDDITEELEEAVFRLLARYSSFQVTKTLIHNPQTPNPYPKLNP